MNIGSFSTTPSPKPRTHVRVSLIICFEASSNSHFRSYALLRFLMLFVH